MLRVAASFSDGFQNTGPTTFQEWDLPRPSRSVTPPPQRGPRDEKAGVRGRKGGEWDPNGGCQSHGGTAEWMVYGKNPIKMDELGNWGHRCFGKPPNLDGTSVSKPPNLDGNVMGKWEDQASNLAQG